MELHKISIDLLTYLSMIGAEVITSQIEYKGDWECKLVTKGTSHESFQISYLEEFERNSEKRNSEICFKSLIATGKSPEEAIKNLCQMIGKEKMHLNKLEIRFPFKEVTP